MTLPGMHTWLQTLFRWRRLLTAGAGFGLVLGLSWLVWQSSFMSLLHRVASMTVAALLVFNTLEHWPATLPRRLPRWILQIGGVTLVIPLVTWAFYVHATPPGAPPFWRDPLRLGGFALLSFTGIFVATWTVLTSFVVQREAEVREQALAFALERSDFALQRSELERQALDARLRLIQAQVEPHFIFNTLANVRALVDSGSPRASTVLASLIAYLRAALPRLDSQAATLGLERDLVQAYLELMQMRMPDRLRYRLDLAPDTLALRCPPLTLMTLVENAVRHGIDPSEEGGEIAVSSRREGMRLHLTVRDSGVGLQAASKPPGTGLSALRERLRAAFGPDAVLRIAEAAPRGVEASLDIPAQP